MSVAGSIHSDHRQQFWTGEVGRQGVWLIPNALFLAEREKTRKDQNWDESYKALDRVLVSAQVLSQPRLEAAITVTMIQVLAEQKRLDVIPAVAEHTLVRWMADPDVQFKVRGAWGRAFAARPRIEEARRQLDISLSQPHTSDDHERLRSLMAANLCVESADLSYAIQARDLARTSADAHGIECARALGEYAIAAFDPPGGQAGAVQVFSAWSECIRAFVAVPDKDDIWRDLVPLFGHATSYLTSMAADGRAPETAYDGSRFHPPARGFLMRDYLPEREALYHDSDVASISLLMYRYAWAVRDAAATSYWVRYTVDEARRAGASFIEAMIGFDSVAELIVDKKYDDAVEMGVLAGRGVIVSRAKKAKTKAETFGVGVDLDAAFFALPKDQRHLGEAFGIIAGAVPLAIKVAHLRISEPIAAMGVCRTVAALFQGLASQEPGAKELWGLVAELFQVASVEHVPPATLTAQVQVRDELGGDREASIRVLASLLAASHSGPRDALSYQLVSVEWLLKWFPPNSSVYRLVLRPYIEAYWRHTAEHGRFAFWTPALTVPAILDAIQSQENLRVVNVLGAAASGFRLAPEVHALIERLRIPPR